MNRITDSRRITPRTLQVVALLAQGIRRKQIAEILKIHPTNVQERISVAVHLTGARDRVHLAYLYNHELFRIGLEALCSHRHRLG